MKITLVCFTSRGASLCQTLCKKLEASGHLCQGFTSEKKAEKSGLPSFGNSLSQWTRQWFCKEKSDGMIFIGACGIAVRAVAPYLQGKIRDPAVVVVDEHGQFAISLLSGHIGNANHLTQLVARQIGSTPVISTATDCNHLFAVDSWAARLGWSLSDMTLAKKVSAQLLEGESIGFASDIPEKTESLPTGFTRKSDEKLGVYITIRSNCSIFSETLRIIPNLVSLGIGCRKGASQETIEAMVLSVLDEQEIDIRSIKNINSIILKQEEPGLLAFAKSHGWPIQFFSPEELANAKGTFSTSSFVQETVGIDNVCERAAVLGSQGGALLIRKQVGHGVTVAAALEERRISFAD
ncbi:MAG: cobalt-precorrin 5A hydrolase [Clostridiales bacterium]|jgi:cobalt-precorrin 5A hydrolase|nr:cobalt-precorrin 5A hydrolase [Clostridiales bacterium]